MKYCCHYVLGLILALPVLSSPALAASRYVSPTGSGSACSVTSPCAVATALGLVTAGDTIYAQDGHYVGSSGLFIPKSSGTAANLITFRAVNEGKAWFDGGGNQAPCDLTNVDYWTIIGINCSNGDQSVVRIVGSSHNIFRRVIAWDVPDLTANSAVWDMHVSNDGLQSCNNLLEDIAGFGRARKTFINISNQCGSSPNTIRRMWGRWEDNSNIAPKIVFDGVYDSRGLIVENVILTWTEKTPGRSQIYGMGSHSGTTNSANRDVNSKWYGSIMYLSPGQQFSGTQLFTEGENDNVHFKDLVVFLPPGQGYVKAAAIRNCKSYPAMLQDCPSPSLSMTGISLIGGAPSSISSQWVQSNVKTGSVVADIYANGDSVFVNNGSKGATVCYQYQNGTLTSTPLWPWPMNQRIIDALRAAGSTPVDVTATIEQLLGPIPAACRGTATQGITSPRNVRITSVTP